MNCQQRWDESVEWHVVDGKRLEARRIPGRVSSCPPIVMLHEGLGSVGHWRDFPDRVARETGSAVFVYSRYGHGRSSLLEEPRDTSYMHHEAEVVLPALLEQADIRKPVLFGHSDGASIAILYAAKFPYSAAALVLAAPHVFVEDGTLRVHIASIRKALGDGQFGNRYIANIHGRGYSFRRYRRPGRRQPTSTRGLYSRHSVAIPVVYRAICSAAPVRSDLGIVLQLAQRSNWRGNTSGPIVKVWLASPKLPPYSLHVGLGYQAREALYTTRVQYTRAREYAKMGRTQQMHG